MGFLLQVLTFLAVLTLLGFEGFLFLKREKQAPQPPVKTETTQVYTLTLKGDVNLAKELLQKGLSVSYSDGRVFLVLKNRKEALEILNLYGNYTREENFKRAVKFAVAKLIGEDIRQLKEELKKRENDYRELKTILTNRGVKLDFNLFADDVLKLQREIYGKTLRYWDQKYRQLLEGYRTKVEEPTVSEDSLLRRAASVYGNDLTYRLFKLWVDIKLKESRLSADWVKYREYGNPR